MKKAITIAIVFMAFFFSVQCHVFSANYDVDGDGNVTIKDATTIQKWLAEYNDASIHAVELDDVASYLQKEMEFIPYLYAEEVSEGEAYSIVDSSLLTEDILAHRTERDVLIVERVIGIVTNRNSDGKVLNTNGDFNYISYKYVREPITVGTVVLTYFIYNPNNNYADDIVNRFDFVIDREHEM